MIFRIFFTCFLLASITTSANACPNKDCSCKTSNGKTEVLCPSIGLESFPPIATFPKDTFLLDLSQNKIEALDRIEELDGLKILKLNNNKLHNITETAFENYNFLEYLDLSHNSLHDLLSLEGLGGLRVLNLSHNFLRNLPEGIFFNLPELVELNLAGNPLHYVRYPWFRQLSRVTKLDLSATALHSLPDGVFHDMLSLRELNLADNSFEDVTLPGLESALKLTTLILNGNKITYLKSNSFKKLKSLEILELSGMDSLQSIRAGAFSGLKQLRVLKISNNPNFAMLDFGAFEGLFNSIDDSWTLQELILRQNALVTIDSPSSALCKIPTVDLQGNPWECDCHLNWFTVCALSAELNEDLKCAGPPIHENKKLSQLGAEDMVCHSDEMLEHQQKVLRVVVVTSGLVGIVFCAIIIVVVVKKRKIMEWWYYRKRGSGAVYYVKAQSNPKDGHGEI